MAKTTKPSTGANDKAPVSSKDVKVPEGLKPAPSFTGTPKVFPVKAEVKPAPEVKSVEAKLTPAATTAQDARVQSGTASTPAKSTVVADTAKKPDVKVVDTADKKTGDRAKAAEAAKTAAPKSTRPNEPVKTVGAPAERPSVFMLVLLGVAVAAVLGFLASELNLFGLRSESVDLSIEFARQQEQITALETAQAAIVIPDTEDLAQQIEGLNEQVEVLNSLEGRVAVVEKRPLTGNTDAGKVAFAAFETQFNDLQTSIEQQSAEVAEQKTVIDGLLIDAQTAEKSAVDVARTAGILAAMSKMSTAVSAGQPFASALAELEAAGASDIPAVLREAAETGVPTLVSLKAKFPENSRAALNAARGVNTADADDGVLGFFKQQLGARSVAPREGSDPDAVLSRAEAAIAKGALTDALAEIDAVPPEAQAQMEDWLASARARLAAEAAAQDLSQRLMAN